MEQWLLHDPVIEEEEAIYRDPQPAVPMSGDRQSFNVDDEQLWSIREDEVYGPRSLQINVDPESKAPGSRSRRRDSLDSQGDFYPHSGSDSDGSSASLTDGAGPAANPNPPPGVAELLKVKNELDKGAAVDDPDMAKAALAAIRALSPDTLRLLLAEPPQKSEYLESGHARSARKRMARQAKDSQGASPRTPQTPLTPRTPSDVSSTPSGRGGLALKQLKQRFFGSPHASGGLSPASSGSSSPRGIESSSSSSSSRAARREQKSPASHSESQAIPISPKSSGFREWLSAFFGSHGKLTMEEVVEKCTLQDVRDPRHQLHAAFVRFEAKGHSEENTAFLDAMRDFSSRYIMFQSNPSQRPECLFAAKKAASFASLEDIPAGSFGPSGAGMSSINIQGPLKSALKEISDGRQQDLAAIHGTLTEARQVIVDMSSADTLRRFKQEAQKVLASM